MISGTMGISVVLPCTTYTPGIANLELMMVGLFYWALKADYMELYLVKDLTLLNESVLI